MLAFETGFHQSTEAVICETTLFQRASTTWGVDSQLDMAIEECAELMEAIVRLRRRRVPWEKVAEELADVHLTVSCLRLIDPRTFDKIRASKLHRLKRLLRAGKQEC